MHVLRVFSALFKINIQQDLAYRADTLVNILVSLMWLGWELTGLAIIFSNTSNIAGWTFGDLLALSGMWRLLNTFMQAIVYPNTEKFNRGIREGTLDYTFLQPVNGQFMVSFSRVAVWNLWNVGLAVATIAIGLLVSDSAPPSTSGIVTFLALTASGSMVIYSLWIVLIALTFWFTKFDNNVTLLSALMDTARFPATVYPVWLRIIVTFVIPIAIATTVPLQALRGNLPWWQIVLALTAGILAFWLSSQLWKAGVKRYSGASA